MSIIWWTLYILGAITIVVVWINLLTIFIKGCNVILKKEWKQGPMPRKDIEAFIRMEINAQLSKIQQKEDK